MNLTLLNKSQPQQKRKTMQTSGEYRDSDGFLVMINDPSSIPRIQPGPVEFRNVDAELVALRNRCLLASETIEQQADHIDELNAEIARLEQLLSGK